MKEHFEMEFADAVVIRECAGDIKVGSVTVGSPDTASVSSRLDSDGKLALDFVVPKGNDGADAVIFTPSVSEEGVLSWENDGGLENPEPVNIKGEGITEAGTMAFKILSVDGNAISLDGSDGLETGMLCSADCGNNYNGFGRITAIYPSPPYGPGSNQPHVIYVDNALINYTVEEDSVFWIPDHPELGTQTIGTGAYSFGVNNKANSRGAFATGEDNIADGKGSYAGGKDNQVFAENAIGYGNNLTVKKEAQSVFGKFNVPSDTDLFQIGNGTSDERKNALWLTEEGNLHVSGTITDGNGNKLDSPFFEIGVTFNGSDETVTFNKTLNELGDAAEAGRIFVVTIGNGASSICKPYYTVDPEYGFRSLRAKFVLEYSDLGTYIMSYKFEIYLNSGNWTEATGDNQYSTTYKPIKIAYT